MGSIRCTFTELARGIEIPLDERTTLVVVPDASCVTLLGRAFDGGRSFLLPRALQALGEVFTFAQQQESITEALVVGHVDPTEDTGQDVTLSEERANVAAAWLKGDVQPWLDRFADSVDVAVRWGSREDGLMLKALPDAPIVIPAVSAPSPNQAGQTAKRRKDPLVEAYQRDRGLSADGIAGPITRKRLIQDYFALTRTAQIQDEGSDAASEGPVKFETPTEVHAAGSNIGLDQVVLARKQASAAPGEDAPAAEATDESSATAPDAAAAPANERIDFLFFFGSDGAQPAPGSAAGPEYLEWIAAATKHRELEVSSGDGSAKIELELFDKYGTVHHARRAFKITGIEEFAGSTDADGRLVIHDVTPGDYTLELTLEFFEGADKVIDTYTSPLVVKSEGNKPQVRALGAVPRVHLARLRGLLFETNKAFLLPSAMNDLKQVRALYKEHSPSELLVVGHTDTTGDPGVNDPLSFERAEGTLAFLKDDVAAWLEFYGSKVPESRRWGPNEDRHMLRALSALDPDADDPLQGFRLSRKLTEQGPAGEETRTQLIKEYMALDNADLDSGEFEITGTAHGCGENFPVDDTGEQLDQAPEDKKEDAFDRRVELFFFDPEFGVLPAPAGKNSAKGSKQYPSWRKAADTSLELGETLDFVSFVVLDEVSNEPLARERFRVTFANGSLVDGQLDAEGQARLTGVPKGNCVLELLDRPDTILQLQLEGT